MKTIISHFYNEEYLLPWWLEHHKKIFDHGILIDYASTDNSVNIIKEICPTWNVVRSRNKEFQSNLIDDEVCHYENMIEGWRIALNITEFLVGDTNKLMDDAKVSTQHLIPSICFFDFNPNGQLSHKQPLWQQLNKGVLWTDGWRLRFARSLHNISYLTYPIGRHYQHGYNTTDCLIFHYANCISSPEMLARRLQIQTRISSEDLKHNHGFQHHNHGKGLDLQSIKDYNDSFAHVTQDCSEFIKKYT
jgi:hypothetical protein